MNAPTNSALLARPAPVTKAARAGRRAVEGNYSLTPEKLAFYADAAASLLELANIAKAIENGEVSHLEHELMRDTAMIRAHCAMGIERIYRVVNDDARTSAEHSRGQRRELREQCAAALGL